MRICRARFVKNTCKIELSHIAASEPNKEEWPVYDVVQDFIDKFNAADRPVTEIEGDFEFLLVHHSLSELIERSEHYMFAQDYYIQDRKIEEVGERSLDLVNLCGNQKRETWLPMVHLTLFDILKNPDDKTIKPLERMLGEQTGRFKAIVDSSIWNYYVPVESIFGNIDFSGFEAVLQKIGRNTIFRCEQSASKDKKELVNLYDLAVTREYADLKARLLKESYLRHRGGHGHGTDVSPFIFHSEQFIRRKIKEEKIYDKLKKYKWRFLLVDDRIFNANLSLGNGNERKESSCSKLDILLRILGEHFTVGWRKFDGSGAIEGCSNPDILIYCAETVNEALDALTQYKFEIVFLDYLLKPPASSTAEYGYQILSKLRRPNDPNGLKDREWFDDQLFAFCDQKKRILAESGSMSEFKITDEELNTFKKEHAYYKIGPQNRLYFMFISAFTTAVADRLLAEGLHRSETFWHIAEGACPTNTPYLFFHNLMHLMKKRMIKLGLDRLNDEELVIFINQIFGEAINTRQKAGEKFNEILKLLYQYKNLLNDVHFPDNEENTVINSEESVLATYFIYKKAGANLGGLLEHLSQLIYLTAFGTVRQWPEMWEEYLNVAKVLGPQIEVEKYIARLRDNIL